MLSLCNKGGWIRLFKALPEEGFKLAFLKSMRCVHDKKIFPKEAITELVSIVGEKNVSTSEAVLEQFGHDEGPHASCRADVVVKPSSVEQIQHIAKLCHKRKIPMIPFGAGSGFEGGVNPVKGGVSIDLNQMNSVLDVHTEDFDTTVEPGISRKTLNTYLRDTGLWFPVDPGADATIGGMASTSASGTNAVRYGTMRENILNLEVVLPDGTLINTAGSGRRPRKTSAGYNLTNLFVGSEGTLGIFTKITLRLYVIPEMITSAVCSFPSVKHAVTTAIQTLQSNIPIARVELLDTMAMKACNKYSKLNYKETPTLFLEFHGTSASVEEQAESVAEIASANGGEQFVWTKDIEERNKLWNARHNLLYAVLALRAGSKFVSSDVCVPISKLPDVIVETQKDIESQDIIGPVLGHVGDGNFHAFMIFDPNNKEELAKIKAIVDRLAKRAWAVGGTCTGEHGIGLGKMHLLEQEIGSTGFDIMKNIKRNLDPLNIMNPGKVLYI